MAKKRQYLVIHCTDTPEGRNVTSADIREWHTAPKPRGNGWRQVGYTHMIHLDGRVEQLVQNNNDDYVDSWEITNGVAGVNSLSLHIVYVGGKDASGKPKDTRTWQQKRAMEKFVKEHVTLFPGEKVVGHNFLDKSKACPSFDVGAWLKQIGL